MPRLACLRAPEPSFPPSNSGVARMAGRQGASPFAEGAVAARAYRHVYGSAEQHAALHHDRHLAQRGPLHMREESDEYCLARPGAQHPRRQRTCQH